MNSNEIKIGKKFIVSLSLFVFHGCCNSTSGSASHKIHKIVSPVFWLLKQHKHLNCFYTSAITLQSIVLEFEYYPSRFSGSIDLRIYMEMDSSNIFEVEWISNYFGKRLVKACIDKGEYIE